MFSQLLVCSVILSASAQFGNLFGGGGIPNFGGGGTPDIGSLLAGGGGGGASSLVQGSQFLGGNPDLLSAADPKSAANAVINQLGVGPQINNRKCNQRLRNTINRFKKFTKQLDQVKDALSMMDQLQQFNAFFPKGQQADPLNGAQSKLLAQIQKLQDMEMLDELLECEKRSRKGYPFDKVPDVKDLVPGKVDFNNPQEFTKFFEGGANFKDKYSNFFTKDKIDDLMDIRKTCIENLEVESEKCKAVQKQACQLMDMMEGQNMADFAFNDINPMDIKSIQGKLSKFQEPLNELKNIDAKVKNCDNLGQLAKGKGNPQAMFKKTLTDGFNSGVTGLFLG